MTNLAPPTPYQWNVGDIGSAALLNSQLYNGLTFLLNRPIFYGYQGAGQSLTSGSASAITIDTNSIDTYNGHSTTTNPSRYTAQQAGYYKVWGVACVNGATSQTYIAAFIAKNGAETAGSRGMLPANSSHTYSVTTSPVILYLNGTTDYVELWAQADGTSPSTHGSGSQNSALCAEFIHL